MTLACREFDVSRAMRLVWLTMCSLFASVLIACGGGGVGEGGTGAPAATASVGVLRGLDDDSLTVNGVSYALTPSVPVLDGFGQSLSAEQLRLGMWVEVRGTTDPLDGQTVAQSVRVRPALRGVVSAKDDAGLTLTVLGSTVRIGNGTVIDGTHSAAMLLEGDEVEVHGVLNGTSAEVSASRVERLSSLANARQPVEMRGRVSNLNTLTRTLTLGKQVVSYSQATVALDRGLADGMMVRVSAPTSPLAGQPWLIGQLISDQTLPRNLGFFYTEGWVEEWRPGPFFSLDDLSTDATKANNRGVVTANGQRVAAVGSLVEGVLQAKSVALVELGEPVVFMLSGTVTGFHSAASFSVRGVTVDGSSATYVSPASPKTLTDGSRLKVTGTMRGRTLVATKIALVP